MISRSYLSSGNAIYSQPPALLKRIRIEILLIVVRQDGRETSLNRDSEHGWRLDEGEGPVDLAIGSQITFEGPRD
jgi:hypothetical protein